MTRRLYFFSYGKGNKNHQLVTGFFAHHITVSTVKLLTLELNPSEQHCLPGFFTGDFKF